jgi:hypothetical protein
MTRLRSIRITGFRGILETLTVDLGQSGQSVAVFGENAVGKSSIADAIEWFYTDRVAHLWKENCKQTALRNTLLPDSEVSEVDLQFTDSRLNCKKTFSSAYQSEYSNSSKEFQAHLQRIGNGQERIILRNIDLWNFILSTKTEKRQQLAQLIGYERLDSFREVIGRVRGRLEGIPDYVAAKRNIPEYQKEMFKIAGSVFADAGELYKTADKMAKEVGIATPILDEESYNAVVSEIRKRIEGKEKAAAKLILAQCKESCDQLRPRALEATALYESFSKAYQDLIRSEEDLRQLKLENFLASGERAIRERLVPADTCPLCLQPKSWASLREELEVRIGKLKESKKKYDATAIHRGRALAAVSEVLGIAREVYKSAVKAEIDQAFLERTKQYGQSLVDLERQIKENFEKYTAISSNLNAQTGPMIDAVQHVSDELKTKLEALELSKEEQRFFDTTRNLENLRLSFSKYRGAVETNRKFDLQIRTLSMIEERFAAIHGSALQKVLDAMSTDISRFYLIMHPNEQVDHVKLRILEEGVEFEYGFHGETVFPPLKYLSESHLNSLGIAAFLASSKLFNRASEFFVLDDIVTSFDSNHRIRLVQLLQEEFSSRQILLLTHEPFWFDMIKKQLGPKGWLLRELDADSDSRLRIKESTILLKQEITRKKNEGSLTANDLRICLERILKDISLALEVKVAFRYNDENERRMSGELLSALRSNLKKKSPDILNEAVFARLEVCSLVATTGSHDSGPVLSSGDIETVYGDVLALDALFCCGECGKYASVVRFVHHEKKIFCVCGKKHLDWKE